MSIAAAPTLALRAAVLQPARFLGAFLCTLAVALSAATVAVVAPSGVARSLAAVYGGITAFNLLLLFPPRALTRPPARLAAGLLVNLVPLPLAPYLYGISVALADLALIAAAGIAVLARPRGPPLAPLATLVSLNLLIPLVLGGGPELIGLGAIAAVSGTLFAGIADALINLVIRDFMPGWDQALLRREVAAYLDALAEAWRAGASLPSPPLAARLARVRAMREEMAPFRPPGTATLPVDTMLEAVLRCAAALRAEPAALAAGRARAIGAALPALAEAIRADAPQRAARALASLRAEAVRGASEAAAAAAARMLGLALMLSDLLSATTGTAR